jgi:hypothetical protein
MDTDDLKGYGLFAGLAIGMYCFGWIVRDTCDTRSKLKKYSSDLESRYRIDKVDGNHVPMMKVDDKWWYIGKHGHKMHHAVDMSYIGARRAMWLAMKRFR